MIDVMSNRSHRHDPVDPIELAMLQRVFDSICTTRSLSKGSPDAEQMAAVLVDLFAHGIRSEHHLTTMVG